MSRILLLDTIYGDKTTGKQLTRKFPEKSLLTLVRAVQGARQSPKPHPPQEEYRVLEWGRSILFLYTRMLLSRILGAGIRTARDSQYVLIRTVGVRV
jgi:hypothetical protein